MANKTLILLPAGFGGLGTSKSDDFCHSSRFGFGAPLVCFSIACTSLSAQALAMGPGLSKLPPTTCSLVGVSRWLYRTDPLTPVIQPVSTATMPATSYALSCTGGSRSQLLTHAPFEQSARHSRKSRS